MIDSNLTLSNPFLKRKSLLSTEKRVDMHDVIKLDDFQSQLAHYDAEVAKILSYAKEVSIDTDEDSAFNIEEAGNWRKLSKRLEAARKEILEPVREYTNKVNALAKGYTDRIEEAIRLIAQKDGQYKAAKMAMIEKQLETERLLDEFLGEASKVIAIEEATLNTTTSTASTYQRLEWDIEVSDLALVPTEFLMLDESAVKRSLRAGRRDIPGLKVKENKITTLRAR